MLPKEEFEASEELDMFKAFHAHECLVYKHPIEENIMSP